MDTKKRRKYEINFSVMFIFGVFFTIWGFILFFQGIEKNKNLKNIYTNNVDISKLEEGNYIKADIIYLLVHELENKDVYNRAVVAYGEVSLLGETLFYLAKFDEASTEYIALEVPFKFTNVYEWINIETGKCDFSNPPKDLLESAKDLEFVMKVKEIDEGGRGIINQAREDGETEEEVYNKKIMLEVVDLNKEKRSFPAGICLLFAGVLAIIFSDPRKIVSERYYEEKEFNLIYEDREREELEPNDIRIIEDIARTLRTEIKYYENKYKRMVKEAINSGIAVAVSGLLFYLIPTIMLLLLIIIFVVKFLFSVAVVVCNQYNNFSKSVLSIFSLYPVKAKIYECNVKLSRCDKVLSYVDVETILKSRY